MELMHEKCAGLDVHKDEVVVCARSGSGPSTRRAAGHFPTTTSGLIKLGEWLEERGCTHVVMESTGVYWKPVWHILFGEFELLLANAKEVRNLPGRKSDMNDATWLADLLAHGLVRSSFVPDEPIQNLRDLTRTRRQLVRECVQHTQRIQKVLEDANIKLSSVIADILGESGRRILTALVEGETQPEKLAALASTRIKASREALVEALRGRVTDHHRFLIRMHLNQIASLRDTQTQFEARIEEELRPFSEAAARLETLPGVSRTVAHVILAEVGPDMSRFPTAAHLVSWAGLCPKMNESAGKRGNTRIREGNVWLKPVLVQAALAASHKKGCYFKAQFNRIRARRGAKKAAVAVAASLLTASYHLLKKSEDYRDLGENYFDQLNKEKIAKHLIKRLAGLGVQVEIKQAA